MKILSDDPVFPYKTTKLKAFYTKSEIDGLFAKRGIKDTHWLWDPEHYEVFVQFKIVEKIDEVLLEVSARLRRPPFGSIVVLVYTNQRFWLSLNTLRIFKSNLYCEVTSFS